MGGPGLDGGLEADRADPDPFRDEVQAVNIASAQRVDELLREHAEGLLSEEQAHAEAEIVLSRRKVERAELYRRHGRTLFTSVTAQLELPPW